MMWTLESPNRKLKLEIYQKTDGALRYCVSRNQKVVLRESTLGICTELGDFTNGLTFVKESEKTIQEEYSLPAGKKEVYISHAKELALEFAANNSAYTVRLRAFDDGVAFRYEIRRPDKDSFQVRKEATEFHISESCDRLWLQDWVSSYEGPYNARTWEKSINDQPFGMPSLFYSEKDSVWLMLNEANVMNTGGSYCACHLIGNENGRMRIGFAPEEKGNPITCPLPFQSPWRYAVITENLDELVNSTVNYNLNPPSAVEDTSWIRPGRALWAWWEDMNGAQLYLESRNYVDMAAALGFEGLTLDCGWDANWVKDLCGYAHKKGIQIWIWTGMQKLDTREKAERLIPLWASWGVDGLKIDFFENDSQHTMWQYNMMADLMIRHKLMINFHGCVKPMGEGRTWPNFMTSEGIMGLEHYQWSDMPDSRHNCTVPFTRNVAGPMDYTPTAFSNLKNRNTTMGHQMALPVVFDSGLTHYALALRYIEGWKGTDFLRRTKSHYKGVKVLSGFPGDHAAILRYTEEEWLIGVITCPKKVITLPLDFLGEGEYGAEIYEDTDKGRMIGMTARTVTAKDTIRLNLQENGGAGIYITRKPAPLGKGVCSGYMSDRYTEYQGRDAKMLQGSEKIRWNEETDGFLLNGEAEISGQAEKTKNYTVRFFYAAEEPWKLEFTCGDFRQTVEMPTSTEIRTFVTHEIVVPIPSGGFTFHLKRLEGKAPGIWKVKVIDNDPFMPISCGIEPENLFGGGEITVVDGIPTATGLGYDAELHFDEVTVPQSGTYVLRIAYAGGDSRDISIQINGGEIIHSYLHNSNGWDFPHWETINEKEYLIELTEGRNQIRLFNDHGLMSHIKGIKVILK